MPELGAWQALFTEKQPHMPEGQKGANSTDATVTRLSLPQSFLECGIVCRVWDPRGPVAEEEMLRDHLHRLDLEHRRHVVPRRHRDCCSYVGAG